ncbi:MutS-related protein [Candidatus Clostridium stratigraminis]|uniref:MutS-related protein n=1 Tax=Candidatus Clostridium stratigraminis TaxID=3381661 RepID=A0ABW8T6W1_9CLOT
MCILGIQEGIKVKFLDSEQRKQVGFSFIIDNLEIMTAFGIEEKKNIRPFKSSEENKLRDEFNNIEIMRNALRKNEKAIGEIERVFCRVKDLRNTVKRCSENITLDDVELYEIKYFSILMEELIEAYKSLKVNIKTIKFTSLNEVLRILDPEGKKIPTFYIYDSYSEILKNIRAEKRKLEELIYKENNEEKIKLLKEERLNTVLLEEAEELRIRRQLTESLSGYALILMENIKSIGKLDFLMSKAKLTVKYNAVKPEIKDSMGISFKDMINPEVTEHLARKNKIFTPLSIELKNGTTVITGANMGGKSIALKTLVLNLMLGQCGFYVFAKEAQFPILNFIYFISDDLQSVSQGLSTFGAEIVKLKEVLSSIKKETGFVALDEFARGTNPKEGYYLVKSLCKYLNTQNSISLISTHYDGTIDDTMTHYQVVGLKNMDFNVLKTKINLNKMKSIDIIQEHMEYKLEMVSVQNEVPKDALNISILLGLQEEVIDIAKKFYVED